MRKFIIAAGLLVPVTHSACTGLVLGSDAESNPQFGPTDFTTAITNPYSSMPVGWRLVYEQKIEDGLVGK